MSQTHSRFLFIFVDLVTCAQARTYVIDLSEDGTLEPIEQRAIDMFCLALKSAPWRVHKWWGLAEYARGHMVEALRHFELQMALAQLPRDDKVGGLRVCCVCLCPCVATDTLLCVKMNECARQIETQWDEQYDWAD